MTQSSTPIDPATKAAIKLARTRAGLFCGAGFAAVGWVRAAVVGHLLCWLGIAGFLWLAIRPCTGAIRLVCAALVACVLFFAIEWAALGRLSSASGRGDNVLTRRFGPIILAACICVVVAAIFVFTNLRAMRMGGDEMAPTVPRGRWLLYYNGVIESDLRPGRIIAFRPPAEAPMEQGVEMLLGRIVAGPGDRIAVKDGRYHVSGHPSRLLAPTGRHPVLVAVPDHPKSLSVPADRYFISLDNASTGRDTRTLSWLPRDRILSSRVLPLTVAGFGTTPIE